jgi:hypothetical protein
MAKTPCSGEHYTESGAFVVESNAGTNLSGLVEAAVRP